MEIYNGSTTSQSVARLRTCHKKNEVSNREARRTLGLREVEVIGGWRKIQNKELRDLYFS